MTGTKDDPWVLKTPPGTSEYIMYIDEASNPPSIVCVVGKTELRYDKRAIKDLQFGMYMPPLLEALGLAELEHNPRNNRMRAK